jgi:hypothetical protein
MDDWLWIFKTYLILHLGRKGTKPAFYMLEDVPLAPSTERKFIVPQNKLN